jgi:hypothetical protein
MSPGSVVIYEWRAWEGFLLPSLFPDAVRLPAVLPDTPEAVLAQVPASARCFAFHVNLTQTANTPEHRDELVRRLRERGLELLNAGVTDTTRRAIQGLCARIGLRTTRASRDGDPGEVLIVKTDLNHGGASERHLPPSLRERLAVAAPTAAIGGPMEYRVASRALVDEPLWHDPGVFIERYVRNARAVTYRVYVLGRRAVVSEVRNERLINRMELGLARRNAYLHFDHQGLSCGQAWIPEDLAAQLGPFLGAARLDFGALDVMCDDAGRCYIVDVNPTPYWGREVHDDILGHLRGTPAQESGFPDGSVIHPGGQIG